MQMNLTLYTVPVGASMRQQFCQELKQLGFGKGVLLLPTGLLQQQVKQEFNIAVSSFDTLANKILNLNGYDYLEEINYRSQQLVVEETLDYYAEQGLFQYLAGLKDKRGFVKHMTSLLSQLSRSGATSEEISNTLTSWGRAGNLGRKDKEIALVYQGYRNMLKLQDRFDLEGKYRLALKILREQEKARLPWQQVYISDFATLDALQLELLVELGKHCQVKIGLCYEKDKAVCAVSKATVDRLEESSAAVAGQGSSPERQAVLQHLVDSLGCVQVKKATLGDEKALVVREYKHQQAEIKGVLAEIKQEVLAGASLQDYAVAVYDLSSYTGLRLLADAYGLPLTLPKAEPLLVQPLTEFLLKLLEAVPDNRQGVEAYFALLSSSIAKLLLPQSLEGMEQLRVDTFFKQRSAVQEAVASQLEERPWLLEQIDAFLASCKQRDTVAGFVETLSGFVKNLNLARELGDLYKTDNISLAGLQNILGAEKKLLDSLHSLKDDYEKCGLAKEKYVLQAFVKVWQEALQEMSLMLVGGRRDGLLVTNAVQLQGTSFKRVYLLGLREGEFPAGNRENWLYNDKERGELQALGVDLPNTFNAYAADYCLFAGAVAAATERLTLSFYKDEEGEESPYINEVQNLFTDLAAELVEDQPLASRAEALERSTSCEATWLDEQVGVETLQAAQIDINRTGVYAGRLEEEELLESLQSGPDCHFSASSLGQYVSCPFKYLGTQLWQQRNRAEKSEQLDGGTRGSIFHDTVKAFVETYLNAKPGLARGDLWEKLQNCYNTVVAQYQVEGKLYDNEYWPLESKHLERMLEWWLDYELAEQGQWATFKPVALEQRFGGKATPLRLETETQQPVYLGGRIDRVDASEEAVFVTDYKSGAAPSNGAFEEGEDLQMAFYLLAAEQLFPDRNILGGNYLSLKKHTRLGGVAWSNTGNANIKVAGKKNAPTYNSWAEVKEACEKMVLEPVEELYKGNFAVQPKDKACDYCPLKDICRYTIMQQNAAAKAQEEVLEDGQAETNASTTGDN